MQCTVYTPLCYNAIYRNFYNASLFLGAGVAGTCTVAPSSIVIPVVSIPDVVVR